MARILPYEVSFVISNLKILSFCERSNKIFVKKKLHFFYKVTDVFEEIYLRVGE